jgi:hypothetical protein
MIFLSKNEYKNRFVLDYHKELINNDIDAYAKYPAYNFVYDKYFVMKSQGVDSNTMNIIPLSFPVFVKPKINLNGGNRGCFIVNNKNEFIKIREKYNNKETETIKELFWSSVIDGQEGSTDFIVANGIIKYELDYKIQKIPGSIIGIETLISNNNKTPVRVRNWLHKHLSTFTGIVNLQYIGNTIIEAGLRPDAGGRFLQWTQNKILIENINYFTETGRWIQRPDNELKFDDVYVVGCYKDYPIIYYIPYPIIEKIMKNNHVQNWHYYIDIQKNGKTYINIVDKNRNKLLKVKKIIETLMNILNIMFIALFLSISAYLIGAFIFKYKIPLWFYFMIIIILIIYSTRIINPIRYIYNNEF